MNEGNKPYDIQNDSKLEEYSMKLKKRNKVIYERIIKQMLKIANNPYFGKPLSNILKFKRHVHIGHFVLIYEINEKEHRVVFLKFAHHDDAYK